MKSSSWRGSDWLDQDYLLIALIRRICNHCFLHSQLSSFLSLHETNSIRNDTHHVSTGALIGYSPTITCSALFALVLDISISVEPLLRILRCTCLPATCDKDPSSAYFEKGSSSAACLQSERPSIYCSATACAVFVIVRPSVRENRPE